MEFVIILVIITAIFVYFWNEKIAFYNDRDGRKKIIGEFVKYESVTVKVRRNHSSTSTFPFVTLDNSTDADRIFKLNFQNSVMKEFKKGEKVELFWSNNELLYWNAYNIGIMKYFPKSWFF